MAILLLVLLAGWSPLAAIAQHAGDVVLGRNGASQLVAVNLPASAVRLPFVSSGSIVGWASSSLGFDRVVNANPGADLYPMNGTGMIDIEIVAIDPGLSLRSFTAFNTVIADAPGESLRMGPANVLHYHPIVLIDASIVGQEFQGLRSVILRFIDASGVNTPSPHFTLSFFPPEAVSRTYELRLLDVHDALDSSADAISDTGVVCGGWYNDDAAEQSGVVHSATELQSLLAPPAGYSDLRMTGINRQGETVGTLGADGFLRNGNGFTVLTPPGATLSQPRAINDAGRVVGCAVSASGATAWSWHSATGFSILPGLPGYTGHGAAGINNHGDVIGFSTRPNASGTGTETAAWLSVSGAVQPITFAGTTGFSVTAISDAGEILVSYRRAVSGDTVRHAIRHQSVWSELLLTPLAGMSDYRVSSLNNHSEIVGSCRDEEGRLHGFRGRPSWLPAISSQTASLSPTYTGGQLELTVAVAETSSVHEADGVTVHAGPSARRLIPAHATASILGTPGSAIWILPEAAEEDVTQLSISPLIAAGIFVADQVHIDLEKIDGPGHLFVFRTDSFGNPVVLVDSSDGITTADRITVNAGSAAPCTWAFTAPGSWRVSFRLRGTLAGSGVEVVSATQTVSFFVDPGSIFRPTIDLVALGIPSPQLLVSGEVGRECVIRTSEDLQTWQTTHRFLTASPSTALPADMSGPRRFYKATFR